MSDVSASANNRRQMTSDDGASTMVGTLSSLLERWKTFAGAMVIGSSLAFAGSFLITPEYEATASLFIDSRSLQPLVTAPGQGPSGDNNAEVSFVESQAKIIASQGVLSRVVAEQGLASDGEAIGVGKMRGLASLLNGLIIGASPVLSNEGRERTARAALASRLTVRRPERTFIVDVTVRARSPDGAARLANAVAKAYLQDQDDANADMARRASGVLTGRLDELRKRLSEAEARVQAFKGAHGLIGTRQQLSSEQQLTEANAQLAQARAQRIQSQSRLDRLSPVIEQGGLESATPETTASATISLLRGKQADAKRQLASVLAQLGPRHPSVRDARDQLAVLDRSIETELKRLQRSAQVEFQRASATEAASKAVVGRLSIEAENTSVALSQIAQLQQEVDIDRNLLNTVLSRAQETGEMERLHVGTARIISAAEPPLRRSSPPGGVIFAVAGGALALWLTAAWIVFRRLRPIECLPGSQAPPGSERLSSTASALG